MVRARYGLAFWMRKLQERAGEKPVQVASELVGGSCSVPERSGPTPDLFEFLWFHVPVSGAYPRYPAYDGKVLLELIEHPSILGQSVTMQAVRPVHRDQMHGSMPGPRNDRSGGPVDLKPSEDEAGESGEHRCASTPSSEHGFGGRVPNSVPARNTGGGLHAWQVGPQQPVLLEEENANVFSEGVKHGFSGAVHIQRQDSMGLASPQPAGGFLPLKGSVGIIDGGWAFDPRT